VAGLVATYPVVRLGPVSTRVRVLPGSYNVRDLGGLAAKGGERVRRGLVYRSDYPAFADDGTGDAVRELALRAVVDLRRGSEAAVECVSWSDHGVTYHRCPIVAGKGTSWYARYDAYLAYRPETVVAAVRHVLDPAGHPVLFHCAAGKDRTGVVAALVLSVLGVDEEAIVADYVLSNDAVEPVLARLRASELYREMLDESSVESQRPQPEAMRAFLAALDEQGGAEGWLRGQGLTSSEIEAGRRALLSGAPS
jgi:protein-tyrosine phosphatase